MKRFAAIVFGMLVVANQAHAWQCDTVVDVLSWQLNGVPPSDVERHKHMPAMLARAVIMTGDVAFEGRLAQETRSPIPNSDFENVLMEYRDVIWLSGPKAGQQQKRLHVLSTRYCDDCPKKRATRVFQIGEWPADTVWLPSWATPKQRTEAKSTFGREVNLRFAACGGVTRAWTGDEKVNAEIQRLLAELRANAVIESRK
jgi:hypothetical protein